VNNSFKELVLSMPHSDEIFDRLNTVENKTGLRSNEALTKYQWMRLWEKGLPASEAAALLNNDLDEGQVELVLRTEKRGSVLSSLFRKDLLSAEQQVRAVSSASGSSFAALVMATPFFKEECLFEAAKFLDGLDKLEWMLANADSYKEQEIFDVLMEVAGKKLPIREIKSFNRLVSKAFAVRPGLLDQVFSTGSIPGLLKTSIASSRWLVSLKNQEVLRDGFGSDDEFAALAFVANPVVDDSVIEPLATHASEKVKAAVLRRKKYPAQRVSEPFESVSDKDTLERLLRRCLPNQYRFEGRPSDLTALALNDNVDQESAQKIFEALRYADSATVPAKSINDARSHLAKRLNLTCPDPVKETGFWNDKPVFSVSSMIPRVWTLSPHNRPWSDDYIDKAHESAQTNPRFNQIPGSSLEVLTYMPRSEVHVYLYHELGNIPNRWELMLNLSKSHLGSLEKLIMAAKRLAR
jgi:hypothetical protein